MLDSAGQPLPLTWWMHGGNVFRYADNCDVPLPNTIALHLMKRYYSQPLKQVGDELTLHYHTWVWNDENGDGRYYWNQARNFSECREDFDITLCHYLLEEEIFPVSFRSGWHYMDNEWQNYIDKLIPFCLHDAWPDKRLQDDEPSDNIYDWSLSSSEWVPFHPSLTNYQLPGAARGWNVRCIKMNSLTATIVNQMFARAAAGKDQLACLWSHLPETDFPDQIRNAHDLITATAKRYPGVHFHHMTAVDAFKAWLKTPDDQAPALTFTDQGGEEPRFLIQTDEPIFQTQPFVAVKDIYSRYQILSCTPTGVNKWEAVSPVKRTQLAKAGVALTDTVGNQSLQLIRYLPDDLFLDNESEGYRELVGGFTIIDQYAWGTDARVARVAAGDSAVIRLDLPVREKGLYQLFFQQTPVSQPMDTLTLVLTQSGRQEWRREIAGPWEAKQWQRAATCTLDPAAAPALYLIARNRSSSSRSFSIDALRITPLIPDRQLLISPHLLTFGEISLFTPIEKHLLLQNTGKEPLRIHSISSQQGLFIPSRQGPLELPPFSEVTLSIRFRAEQTVTATDSLIILSDDPITPRSILPMTVQANAYFITVDNADSSGYREYGDWRTSNAQAWGPSSRYVNLSDGPGTFAQFTVHLPLAGRYSLAIIVPKTANASDHALYRILCGGRTLDSLYVDQNSSSGTWVTLGEYDLSAGVPVLVQVIHAGGQNAGTVLRADAIRFTLLGYGTGVARRQFTPQPVEAQLFSPYPNPFNTSTVLRFYLPSEGEVNLDIYDVQGRRVRSLISGRAGKGEQESVWDGRDEAGRLAASGLYFAVLFGTDFMISNRMFLIR
ncbi:MAG TPA: FlgD immunoglobulin-like domain containing protein [bacterium]|nr:FlgD immunoglobulin-like domain containing protein [bacterium]HQI49216.1 FlgD immunoglobulin-like domain containing protein [bacterium]HQJ63631.1 FlgD immunoglobulin-like domain containing protein [bacterium]